jgi:selenocysteine-specific elongation factor
VRALVIGTAGHIDHGKSALVRALTGIDPDRLKEEQQRGITIDLGFAHLRLPDGPSLAFIDVPGHERFVRNMLAGAHGIDAVLLVVAADESVMPQTREHFHICRLLGVRHGLVALTKVDLVDAETLALARLELREFLAGSFLAEAPVLPVSARTGAGLEALREALGALGTALPARPADGLLRLPLDRVFTLHGFGTVVTGTLVAGSVAVGDELELYPRGRRVRVRGLQVHGDTHARAEAGTRVALNLAGLDVQDAARGDVLARPGSLVPSALLDVQVTLLPGQRLADQARVRVHVASAEVLARLRRLEGQADDVGGTFFAQLRLERPAVAGRGDRLILRSYSPSTTLGGALVLDPAPVKQRASVAVRQHLGALLDADARQAARVLLAATGPRGLAAAQLAARVSCTPETLATWCAQAHDVLALGVPPQAYMARAALDELAARTLAWLTAFHAQQPLKAGAGREELRRQVFGQAPAGSVEHVLARLEAAGELRATADQVALQRHRVTLSPAEQATRDSLLAAADAAGFRGLELPVQMPALGDARLLERVQRLLLAEGLLQRVGDSLLLHRAHLEALKLEVRRRWPPGSRVDVAALKDLTGLSRKFTIPLLEYLDRERVTRRAGTERVVLS